MLRSKCVHYWIIEPPAGPTSMGRCRGCGKRKQFANVMTDYGTINWNSPLFSILPSVVRLDYGSRFKAAEELAGIGD